MSNTPPSSPGEFELIREYFCHGFPQSADTLLAIGDDASVVLPPAGSQLVQSIDTQVADVHFPASAPAALIAQRALRCAVSDLAAMGATPQGFHLALTLPDSDSAWLTGFSSGLKKAAHELNIALIGGDTTRGKQRVISVAVQGWIKHDNTPLTRAAAEDGDGIYLSGPVGAAALALPQVLNNPADYSGLAQQYYFPAVHLSLGQALLGRASACIDVSDGLLQDAGHIARSSALQLHIDTQRVSVADDQQRALCLTGGDDYQLLLCGPATLLQPLTAVFPQLHHIGECRRGEPGVVLSATDALLQQLSEQSGFNHF